MGGDSKLFIFSINLFSLKIINIEDWGLRDLSYKIGTFKKAFYKFYQIEIDATNMPSIKKNLTQ